MEMIIFSNSLLNMFCKSIFRKLANNYKISGIPALIIIDKDGNMLSTDGRSDVQVKKFKDIYFKECIKI